MAPPIIWTDDRDALLLQEFDRLGSFAEVTKSLRASGFMCGQTSARRRFKSLRPDEYEAISRKRPNKPPQGWQEIEIVRLLRKGLTGAQIVRSKGYSKNAVTKVRRKYGMMGVSRYTTADRFVAPAETAAPAVLKKKRLFAYYNGQRAPVSHADHFPKFDRVSYEAA